MEQTADSGHRGEQKQPRKSWRSRLLDAAGVAAHLVVLAGAISILAQVLYPAERVVPGTSVDGRPVGLLAEDKLLKKLDTLAADAEITIKTPAKTREVPWATMGITVDRLATAELALEYKLWERLVPFSGLARMAAGLNYTPLVIVDEERLDAFAEKIAKQDQKEVQEASIVIKNGEVEIDPAKAGYVFEPKNIKQQLLNVPFSGGATITLEPQTVPAVHRPEEVRAAAAQAERLMQEDVALHFNGQTVTPAPETVGSWLDVKENETGKLSVAVKSPKLKTYLENINEQYAAPPEKPIRVTLLDGREIKRTEVDPGLAMDVDAAASEISGALLDGYPGAVAWLPVVTVQPEVVYNRTYSKTSKGLKAIIDYWEKTTYGNYGIVVREIGGKRRYAEFGADKRFVTASTFKLYLAYAVFKKIEAGEMKPGESSGLPGWTVQDCVAEMIINSTNPCAKALQNKIGLPQIQNMLEKAGFSETDYDNSRGGDKYSTVSDEADFLLRLYHGNLMNQKHTNRLLYLMKNQIWREGIPAGVPSGTVVANKVGFYDGWIHDVGIVYSPDATYILAVMSRGGSDPVFAELSRRVHRFFNR